MTFLEFTVMQQRHGADIAAGRQVNRITFMLSIFKNIFGQRQSELRGPNSLAHKRFKEHEAGWTVFKAGQPIAKLSFIRIDPPTYLFHVTLIGEDPTQKRFFEHTARRKPDPELTFHNQADPTLTVADGPFLATLWPDGVVHLRDFRISPVALAAKNMNK